MALPINRPFQEVAVYARTTSIGAGGLPGSTVAISKGLIQRVFAFSEGAASGTITVAVTVNAVAVASFTFTGALNARGSFELATPVSVEDGDLITFTPSGGAGATIPGHFYAVIR